MRLSKTDLVPGSCLLTRQQAAERIGCSVNHLRTLPIPIVKIGRLVRYHPSDVDKFIASSRRA